MKNAGQLLLAAFALGCALSSCDSAIYDDEGDCTVTYRLEPSYRKNMKWADAFSSEVSSVRLFAFDSEGVLAGTRSERIETRTAGDYAMPLDLPAGNYRLVAWCGLDGSDGMEGKAAGPASFTLPEVRIGQTRIEELQCRLDRSYDAGGRAVSDRKLAPLFHGTADVTLPTDDDGGAYAFPLELTKNTNHIRVILQQLSGEPADVRDFSFRIEAKNGLMEWDNSLPDEAEDETITYLPHDLSSGSAGLGIDDYPEAGMSAAPRNPRAITSVGVAIADFTIARLMAGRETTLTVETVKKNPDGTPGETIEAARIPLAEYALLLKDGYSHEFAGDQDYLDRQDEYALVLFLDENRKWIETSIIINSWKYVFNKVDFNSCE